MIVRRSPDIDNFVVRVRPVPDQTGTVPEFQQLLLLPRR